MTVVKVKMLRTTRGSADGIKVREYTKGEEYDLPDSLARAFVSELKVARAVTPKARAEAQGK